MDSEALPVSKKVRKSSSRAEQSFSLTHSRKSGKGHAPVYARESRFRELHAFVAFRFASLSGEVPIEKSTRCLNREARGATPLQARLVESRIRSIPACDH